MVTGTTRSRLDKPELEQVVPDGVRAQSSCRNNLPTAAGQLREMNAVIDQVIFALHF